jgi:hypothetical protein
MKSLRAFSYTERFFLRFQIEPTALVGFDLVSVTDAKDGCIFLSNNGQIRTPSSLAMGLDLSFSFLMNLRI